MDSTSLRESASPVPSIPDAAAPRRSNGVNSRGRSSGAIPAPVSLTSTRVRSCPAPDTSTRTSPASRLYLMAFDTRLMIT
jgi:hypothetical protein